ncbi:hypothetical protein H696_06363 [Fonticula alba]|uniref:Uncharacterized protein n=1 Tax=Fonticula alba TaxID=691883 RepID=A0A058Z0Z8_FONAL|nr:hypothetical protein H696_06363 [Fonticula alba]KCV67217.1 hypothetical protein H696_06363 [Fonticula alba]|eukprot:XP_009498378.1 hypothetical protein H696_06363 [Fonticula alba]
MRLIRNVRYSRVAILAGIMILGLMGFLFWSSAPGPGMSGGGLAESPHLSQQRQQPPAKSGPSRTTGDADVLPPVVGRPGEVVNRKGLVPKPTPHRPYDPSLQPGVPLGAWSKYLEDPYYHLPVRSIPDTRPRGCPRDDAVFAWADHPEADLKGVPSVSVIICFRNESATMLSATVATVLERTPVALLDRIVLVDDNGPETGFRDVPIGDATPEQLELMDPRL